MSFFRTCKLLSTFYVLIVFVLDTAFSSFQVLNYQLTNDIYNNNKILVSYPFQKKHIQKKFTIYYTTNIDHSHLISSLTGLLTPRPMELVAAQE